MNEDTVVTIVMMNKGRGSGYVGQCQIDAFVEQGYCVNVVCPHDVVGKRERVNWVKVDLKGKPVPVHEHLPGEGQQVQACTLPLETARAYIDDYKEALVPLMEQTSFLLTHHANLSTIAVHEANQSWQKPYGVFAHGTGIEGYILARRRDVLWDMLLAALNDATAIFVTSEYVKQALLAPYISAEALENVVVIPLPVDMRLEQRGEDREKLGQAFLQLMEGVSQPYILYVGALLDSKGAMALAHASGVYSTHAQTIFAGDGALRRMLTQQGQCCIETGYVTEEEKAYLMKNAYLIAVPSLKKEHFGLTVIEAMISGTPPIAYRQGGIPEIIQENQTGFFVDHVTSDDLGQKILWLLEHPEVVEQARRQVKAYALNKYSWQNTGARFIMKVQDLLKSEVSVPV